MQDTELITKIKSLKQIKPEKEWAVLIKSRILREIKPQGKFKLEIPPFFAGLLARWQPVYIIPVLVLTIVAISGFALNLSQSSLPGDYLYSLRRIFEEAQVVISSDVQKPKVRLEMANKRLEDLSKIAQVNRVRSLAPTIKEFQANVSEAAKDLVRAEATTSNPLMLKAIAQQAQELEKNRQKIESLGVEIGGTKELDDVLAGIVEREIKDLENRTLTDEQLQLLKEAQGYYDEGDYSQALEKILLLSYPEISY